MSRPKCDFCSTENVRWTYPTRDFTRTTAPFGESLTFNSAGGWAACPACHGLIERGDRDRLARRSARRHPERGLLSLKTLTALIRGLHDDFWMNRNGPPVPCDPDDDTDPTAEVS